MPTNPPQLALGYFARFMVAYGKASDDVRTALAFEEAAWVSGHITDQLYVLAVSSLLGIDPPLVYT